MDLTSWLKAVVLGLVEGITEFIPVSSTGHLILVGEWLRFEGDAAVTFQIVIQLGAILAVLWLHRTKVLGSLVTWRKDPVAGHFLANLAIAFAPAAAVGFLTHEFIKEQLFDPHVVAWSLVAGGVAILGVERWCPPATTDSVDEITHRQALGIGLAQILALIPGVSRSGATIMGALALGNTRPVATEFSFFLAIPVMIAATMFELLGNLDVLSPQLVVVFAVGFVMSFLSAMIVVKTFLWFVSRHTFIPFAWYRIVIGTALLVFL